jgi:hypothetical protein
MRLLRAPLTGLKTFSTKSLPTCKKVRKKAPRRSRIIADSSPLDNKAKANRTECVAQSNAGITSLRGNNPPGGIARG